MSEETSGRTAVVTTRRQAVVRTDAAPIPLNQSRAMASSRLFCPLPSRERVGRGGPPVSSTLRTSAVFLQVAHVLGLGGLHDSSGSEGATVHSLGRQPQDPEIRQEKPFPASTGRHARAAAEVSVAPIGARNGEGDGSLGDILGLAPQAINCRRYAAGENTDEQHRANPRLWVACGRCGCKPL